MARVRLANRKGTAEELSLSSVGLSASGESQWSRNAAHAAPSVNPRPVRFHGRHTLAQQIAECERRIAHMECELKLCERSEKDKRDRLNHDLGIRMRFLTKLYLEKDEP
jgi:hypothetical protein